MNNDYTRELAPKIEFFDDRIEITSYGSLPEGLSKEDFFTGVSIPRNKELMRIYRDLEMVEQLGSGLPRILQIYGEECFYFSDSYTRMSFPVTEKANNAGGLNGGLNELEELLILIEKKTGVQLKEILNLKKEVSQRTIERQIAQLIEKGLVERRGSRKTGGYFVIAIDE